MEPWLAGLLLFGWLMAVLFFRVNRIWLPYYVIGAVGLALAIIFIGRATFVESSLQQVVAAGVHAISGLTPVPTRIFQSAPGAIMVLVVDQSVGWTMLQITVESSGLLETGVISGMLMFYPGWSLRRRVSYSIIAILATYVANIIRLMVIVIVIHYGGKDTLLVSHTILGRAVFFIGVVLIYWYLLSRPTLRTIARKLDAEMRE
ncbi:MAG: archaeosortase/exosortase family protein [Chloroflexi bacterium]|nr:archaeosortase/exosortase family protein [Chloroflexota bacterium]MCH8222741.1 archaeosortase/exosortase family protein [Chloroflexota bacterium]